MKIEKVNENQIVCTLSSQDLINNKIKLSELAFGTENAKQFFQNIMVKAQKDVGFNGLNTPLMVEAVPQLPDCLKLIITKVNGNNSEEAADDEQGLDIRFQSMDGVLNLFRKLRKSKDLKGSPSGQKSDNKGKAATSPMQSMIYDSIMGTAPERNNEFAEPLTEAFRFASVDGIIPAAKALQNCFDGENSLYKDGSSGEYLLIMHSNCELPEEFNKICNILSEYSIPVSCSQSTESYLKEHGNSMIEGNALQILSQF